MQTNPQVQYNQDDAALSLEKELINSETGSRSDASQDEADLSAVETSQTEMIVISTQVISDALDPFFTEKENMFYPRMIIIGSVFVVVGLYALIALL